MRRASSPSLAAALGALLLCLQYMGTEAQTFEFFTQKLDHFNSSETRTFQQAYLVNDLYFEAGGPILFITGFEAGFSGYEIYDSATFYPDGFQLHAVVVRVDNIHLQINLTLVLYRLQW